MKFAGHVGADAKLFLDNRNRLKEFLKTLIGRRVTVEVKPASKRRSLQANAFYWACIVGPLAQELGYDEDEMHGALRDRFLRDHGNEREGFARVRSTTELSTAEFAEYCEKCIRLAAEMGVVVEDPDEGRL